MFEEAFTSLSFHDELFFSLKILLYVMRVIREILFPKAHSHAKRKHNQNRNHCSAVLLHKKFPVLTTKYQVSLQHKNLDKFEAATNCYRGTEEINKVTKHPTQVLKILLTNSQQELKIIIVIHSPHCTLLCIYYQDKSDIMSLST